MAKTLEMAAQSAVCPLTIRELREAFGIARSSVYRWLDRGLLRQIGKVRGPDDYKQQRIALVEVVDEELRAKLALYVERKSKRRKTPLFLAQRMVLEFLEKVEHPRLGRGWARGRPQRPKADSGAEATVEPDRLTSEIAGLVSALEAQKEAKDLLVDEIAGALERLRTDAREDAQGKAIAEVLAALRAVGVCEEDVLDAAELTEALPPSTSRDDSDEDSADVPPTAAEAPVETATEEADSERSWIDLVDEVTADMPSLADIALDRAFLGTEQDAPADPTVSETPGSGDLRLDLTESETPLELVDETPGSPAGTAERDGKEGLGTAEVDELDDEYESFDSTQATNEDEEILELDAGAAVDAEEPDATPAFSADELPDWLSEADHGSGTDEPAAAEEVDEVAPAELEHEEVGAEDAEAEVDLPGDARPDEGETDDEHEEAPVTNEAAEAIDALVGAEAEGFFADLGEGSETEGAAAAPEETLEPAASSTDQGQPDVRNAVLEVRGELMQMHEPLEQIAFNTTGVSDRLEFLSGEAQGARVAIEAVGQQVGRLAETSEGPEDGGLQNDPIAATWIAAGLGLLVLTWVLALHLQLGNPRLSLVLLLGANATACAAILAGRRRLRRNGPVEGPVEEPREADVSEPCAETEE